MSENWKCITSPTQSFAGLPVCTQLSDLEADIAIIGLHYVSPYAQRLAATKAKNVVETAPDAIRRQSAIFIDHLDHYDFDFNDVLLPDRRVRIVDCGDLDKQLIGGGQNLENITAGIRTILSRGAIPIAMGNDEGGCIPLMRAYDVFNDLCVVHIDAHIDWRDERDGERDGYSSVMRRASEMPWVKAMVQVGLRGIGSARQQEVDAALEFGSVFIRAREVHREGIDACIKRIPTTDHYLITIDTDALDTAIAPGVLFSSPGGLTFDETTDLVQGVARKGSIVGINLFEIRPELDINNLTASTGAQLIINFIGTLTHSGQIGN
ncbi:MAG: arginase family protein [Deltaproteobacteria bacterium]|nr:arginase family protein [Deltaproteobacteria bacterium]